MFLVRQLERESVTDLLTTYTELDTGGMAS